MNPQRQQVALGMVLVIFGVLLLAANLAFLDFSLGRLIGVFWPLLLIGLGLWKLYTDQGVSLVAPIVLIGLGAVFLLPSTGILDWGVSWPLILIVIGGAILFQGAQFRRAPSTPQDPDTINLVTLFGGAERSITSQAFRGGKVVSIFGGSELDMREARLAPGATLEVTALFGGAELKVPKDWRVDVEGTALFGGIENNQRQAIEPDAPTLLVRSSVTFGGLEVKR
ncbi:MAG: hypothetical protein HY681_04895 [Chloroflexi bacterium]|nr:hypothetical protein [Chloroflexota bacterium]